MKHLNLSPDLEKKKDEIMEQFREQPTTSKKVAPPELARKVMQDATQNETNNADKNTSSASAEDLRERVVEALQTIYDPEIPVNIYDLGLIYRVDIKDGFAEVDMTLTTPGCPVAQTFPGMVEGAVKLVPGIVGAAVELVWEPPWTQANISEAARLELGLI